MSSRSAARRASLLSSIRQQPRLPVRNSSRFRERAMWTPTTSWPASLARAAATAESTPPDSAASTFTASRVREPDAIPGSGGVRDLVHARFGGEQIYRIQGRQFHVNPRLVARTVGIPGARAKEVAVAKHKPGICERRDLEVFDGLSCRRGRV